MTVRNFNVIAHFCVLSWPSCDHGRGGRSSASVLRLWPRTLFKSLRTNNVVPMPDVCNWCIKTNVNDYNGQYFLMHTSCLSWPSTCKDNYLTDWHQWLTLHPIGERLPALTHFSTLPLHFSLCQSVCIEVKSSTKWCPCSWTQKWSFPSIRPSIQYDASIQFTFSMGEKLWKWPKELLVSER